jgi:protein involved in temperature-dependent protein secretion
LKTEGKSVERMMRDADQLLKSGDLDGARRALVEAVRSSPSDASARMFLFQVLALAGEWDKARIQLDALAKISPEAQMLSVVYGRAIAAERERADVIAGRALAVEHVASDWMQGVIEALQYFGQGRVAEGEAARDAAFDAAPDTAGTLDGAAFDWIADADGRFGPCFEAVIGGRYGLQAFDQIERIVSEGPLDLRDVIWYPVQITFRTGQSVAALLPARYPGTETEGDSAERLGRSTSWRDGAAGSVGSGQHLWSLSNGDEHGLLSLRALVFA